MRDAERLRRSGLIDPARVAAVEAGACPHTVIREDPTLNIEAAEALERQFPGVDLEKMRAEALGVRDGWPVVTTNCRANLGVEAVVAAIERDVLFRA